MKILELFSGYGTASFALKSLGIDFEIVGYSDIDKYANQCFKQNHFGSRINNNGEVEMYCPKELGDVKLIDPYQLEDFDLLTAGFPCQSFSNAGKMLGEVDPRGTLFYEIIRIAEVKNPKYMLLENVKGLTCKKFKDTFNKILSELDRIGYDVHWKILNTKDYGIPQSRARVWFVCFRKDLNIKYNNNNSQEYPENTEKAKTLNSDCTTIELDGQNLFSFPEPVELKIFIKDILEQEVDKKYYLSDKLQERFMKYLEDKESKIIAMRQRDRHGKNEEREQQLEPREDGCSNSLTSVQKDNLLYDKNEMKWFGREIKTGKDGKNPLQEANRIYDVNGISQTIKPIGLKIYDRKGFDSRTKGFRENDLSPTLSTKMGTGGNNVPMVAISNSSPRECEFKEDISPTLLSRDYKDPKIVRYGMLRRLTPKECFRLQGFLNDEIDLTGLSDTQCYRLAGNGQTLAVVKAIFQEMFKHDLSLKK